MACISESRANALSEVYKITTDMTAWRGAEMERYYLTLDEAETAARSYVKHNAGVNVAVLKQRFGRTKDHLANVCQDATGRIWTDLQSMEGASLL